MSAALAPALLLAHDVGVSSSPARRRFTAAYKLKVVTAAAACAKPGDLAALLRREGLYSSHLAAWRAAYLMRGEPTVLPSVDAGHARICLGAGREGRGRAPSVMLGRARLASGSLTFASKPA